VWRREISVHSDQYSFAATWYEMRTGNRVFPGTSIPEVALQHMSGAPELSKVPEAEQKVLLRALSKEPNERFPSCAEFVQGLREVIEPRPKELPPAKGSTGRRVFLGCALALIVVATIRFWPTTTPSNPDRDNTAKDAKTVQQLTDWRLPAEWVPASDNEPIVTDQNQRRFYRQIKRTLFGQTVVMVIVPKRGPDDPATFYMMRDKVWNDLFRAYRDDRQSKAIREYFGSRPGCSRLAIIDENEWKSGAIGNVGGRAANLGVQGKDRGRVPVFRVTPFEAACMAKWMGGKLPSLREYRRAAGIYDIPPPEVLNKAGDRGGLPLNPADGPWPVDKWGRDEIGEGCRQLVSNGKEYTRDLYLETGELPLDGALSTPNVTVVGTTYLSRTPPTADELKGQKDSAPCNAAVDQNTFRVVLEEK
jgi:hypothetical protein